MGAFNPAALQPPPAIPMGPGGAPPAPPASDRLAGKTNLQGPTLEQSAQAVKSETDSLKQLVRGFALEYPQAEKAAETALEAIQLMADSVMATLEPPLGAAISPPPGL
jgi:hypothetical protein